MCLKMCCEISLEDKLINSYNKTCTDMFHILICSSGILCSSMTRDFSTGEFLEQLSRARLKTGDLRYRSLDLSSSNSESFIDASNSQTSLQSNIFH